MYFMIRYPGLIGHKTTELQADRIPALLASHGADPLSNWERRHRRDSGQSQPVDRSPRMGNNYPVHERLWRNWPLTRCCQPEHTSIGQVQLTGFAERQMSDR